MQSDPQVRLKDVAGMKPELYLPILYAAALLLLFLAVFLLPGMLRHGSLVRLESNVSPALIEVDGIIRGYAQGEIFIDSGSRQLTLSSPGFMSHSETIEVPGRLFFSLLFPSRVERAITLVPDPQAIAAYGEDILRDAAGWSHVPASSTRQVPPLFDQYATSLSSTGDTELMKTAAGVLASAYALAASDQQLRDLLRAESRIVSGGGLTGGYTLSALIRTVVENSAEVEGFAATLRASLRPGISSGDRALIEGLFPVGDSAENALTLSADSTSMPSVVLQLSQYFPGAEDVSVTPLTADTLIMSEPVSSRWFSEFVMNSGLWQSDWSELSRKGLLSNGRLLMDPAGNNLSASVDGSPVRAINLLSIVHFISHINREFESSGFEYRARLALPSELTAAYLLSAGNGSSPLPGAESGLWEFTGQYAPASYAPGLDFPQLVLPYDDLGAWLEAGAPDFHSQRRVLQLETPVQLQRGLSESGILLPSTISPVVGFRLVFERLNP